VAVLPCAIDNAFVACLTCQAVRFTVSGVLRLRRFGEFGRVADSEADAKPCIAFHFTHPRCVPAACACRMWALEPYPLAVKHGATYLA
jgi:hypothetical protein